MSIEDRVKTKVGYIFCQETKFKFALEEIVTKCFILVFKGSDVWLVRLFVLDSYENTFFVASFSHMPTTI